MLDSPHSFATVFCVLLLVVFTVVVVDVVVVDGSIPVPTLLRSFAAVFEFVTAAARGLLSYFPPCFSTLVLFERRPLFNATNSCHVIKYYRSSYGGPFVLTSRAPHLLVAHLCKTTTTINQPQRVAATHTSNPIPMLPGTIFSIPDDAEVN